MILWVDALLPKEMEMMIIELMDRKVNSLHHSNSIESNRFTLDLPRCRWELNLSLGMHCKLISNLCVWVLLMYSDGVVNCCVMLLLLAIVEVAAFHYLICQITGASTFLFVCSLWNAYYTCGLHNKWCSGSSIYICDTPWNAWSAM